MNKTLTISTLVLAFIGGFFIFYNPKTPLVLDQNDSSVADIAQGLEPKTDEQASVTVTVTPVDISPESKEWSFDVIMNTHSVELDQDLIQTATLVDDTDREHKPLNWEGSVGGHHREGILIFTPIKPLSQTLKLKISGIGEVERNFTWQIR